MSNVLKYIGTLLLLAMVSACAPVVHTDFDRTFDFGRLESYALLQAGQSHTGNAMLDGPLVGKRILQSLNDTLQANGYVASSSPDFYVDYLLGTQIVRSEGSGLGYGVGFIGSNVGLGISGGGMYRDEKKMVLTISIYGDQDKSVLLWRGMSKKTLRNRSTSADDIDELIQSMVTVILEKLPGNH